MFETALPNVTIIIPVFNEYDGLPFLVKSLTNFFEDYPQIKGEVIFVNDGSTDRSGERLSQMMHGNYIAKVVKLSRNFGSHAALRAGISFATCDYICFNYADLQDPLELIPLMRTRMQEGNDIIWAQRESTEETWFIRQMSGAYGFLMKRFAFKNFPDKGIDIVMFNRKVSRELVRNPEANSSIFLQILGLGFRQQYISYQKRDRKTGTTKWTFSKKLKLFIDSFVAFSFAPIRLVSIIGLLFFLFGLIWTGYIIFRKLVFDDLASGWPALISILMVGFGITNISLGVIAEYLWRTLDASRKRPVYIVDEMVEVNKEAEVLLAQR